MKSTQNRPTVSLGDLTFHQSTLWAAAPAGIYKVLGAKKKDAKNTTLQKDAKNIGQHRSPPSAADAAPSACSVSNSLCWSCHVRQQSNHLPGVQRWYVSRQATTPGYNSCWTKVWYPKSWNSFNGFARVFFWGLRFWVIFLLMGFHLGCPTQKPPMYI